MQIACMVHGTCSEYAKLMVCIIKNERQSCLSLEMKALFKNQSNLNTGLHHPDIADTEVEVFQSLLGEQSM